MNLKHKNPQIELYYTGTILKGSEVHQQKGKITSYDVPKPAGR